MKINGSCLFYFRLVKYQLVNRIVQIVWIVSLDSKNLKWSEYSFVFLYTITIWFVHEKNGFAERVKILAGYRTEK